MLRDLHFSHVLREQTFRRVNSFTVNCLEDSQHTFLFNIENAGYSLFQMVMCIPLICISNRRELVQTY